MSLGIEVHLLGAVALRVDGRPVPVPGARQRVALAALALAPGGTLTSETLADHLWGDELPAQVRPALHTTITRLRKLVGTDRVVSTAGGYALVVPDDAVDVRRFRALVSAARQERDPHAEASLLQEARELWRGEPLDGMDSERLRAEHVIPLTEEWFAATERLIDLRLAAGEHGELLGDLRALISRHPLRESLWSRLMRALAATGRQSEALEAYQEIRTELLDRLGVDPGRELLEAHAAILAGSPDLGETDAAPPAPARAPVPRQLPADFATFKGRADQLSMLDELVAAWDADSARRTTVAVIDGAGGMGKTALAVHWSHQAAKWFPDGQLYVNLRGYGPGAPVDPSVAAGAMLGALAVPDEQIPADPDARSALLRTSLTGRRVLLLLDNARDTDQVRALLPGSSAFVIVTSRSQLRGLVTREGARRLTVAEMSEAESVSVLEHAGGAQRTAGEDAAREVARLCAGVPLALAVAAERLARAAGGRVDQVLAELRDEQVRLDALSAGDDQSTDVRAVLSWSYQAVNEEEARLFRLLAVTPGLDVSTPAAAVLVGSTEAKTRRLLDRLVDAHLLREKTAGRYEQHDLIRVYAAELAADETDTEREAALRRVWSWYRGTALNARRKLMTHQSIEAGDDEPAVDPSEFDNRAAALAWFEAEFANLAGVVWEAAEAGADVLAWQVAAAMGTYFTNQRPWDHPMPLLERGLACARRTGDRYGEAMLLASLGDSHHFRQDYEESLALSRRALAAFRAVGNTTGEVGMLANIAMTLGEAGQLEAAIEHHQLAVAACAALDDPRAEALVLGNLAAAYNFAGRHDDAIETADHALRVSRAAELPVHEADVLDELGAAHAAKGEHRAAVAYFHQALELYRATGHPYELLTLDHLAEAHRVAGDAELARETWRRALTLATDSGHPHAARIRAQLAAL